MKLPHSLLLLLLGSFLLSCRSESSGSADPLRTDSFATALANTPSIRGNPAYLASPYVTPGDRAYMVGHQDGSFPDLGWHIKGEMGGIWAHPIKLMDGFEAFLTRDGLRMPLGDAVSFTNYPMANRHDFSIDSLGLAISRWQFVPDGREGVVIAYTFTNKGSEAISRDRRRGSVAIR